MDKTFATVSRGESAIVPAATCRSRPFVWPNGVGAGAGDLPPPNDNEHHRDNEVARREASGDAEATVMGFFSRAESGRDDRRKSCHFLEAFALEGVDTTPRATTGIFPLSRSQVNKRPCPSSSSARARGAKGSRREVSDHRFR